MSFHSFPRLAFLLVLCAFVSCSGKEGKESAKQPAVVSSASVLDFVPMGGRTPEERRIFMDSVRKTNLKRKVRLDMEYCIKRSFELFKYDGINGIINLSSNSFIHQKTLDMFECKINIDSSFELIYLGKHSGNFPEVLK